MRSGVLALLALVAAASLLVAYIVSGLTPRPALKTPTTSSIREK
jgi:hypothetical protein